MTYEEIVKKTRKKLLQRLIILEDEAEKLAKEIVKTIQDKLKDDLSNLDQLIDQYLSEYVKTLSNKLFASLKTAAELGTIENLFIVGNKSQHIEQVVQEIIETVYPDGLNLSQRVWRWEDNLKKGLKQTLLNQMKLRNSVQKIAYELQYTIEQIEKGKFTITMAEEQLPKIVKKLKQTALLSATNGGDLTEWRKIVKQVEKYIEKLTDNIQYGLKPAYKELLQDLTEAIIKRSEKAVNEAIRWWIYDKQLYNLKRIARTEMSNAYHLSIIKSTESNPLVIGYKWKLSPTHKVRDICDDLAHQDRFGLGPGVFPKDKVPRRKAHPQCMCYLMPVLATEIESPQ